MKQRMINTRFWDDDYTSNLDPIEKLLFLYFLTNTSTNISGIYEIPLKKIAVETGVDKEMVLKVIDRFTKEKKIFYYNGWICIKNFIKHQNQRSNTVQKGIEIEIMAIPKDIIEKFIGYGYGIDTLSYLNLNSNLNSNLNKAEINSADVVEIINSFEGVNPSYSKWFKNTTQRDAIKRLVTIHGKEQLLKVIAILPQTNKISYVPTITTPLQLEDKWASLEANLTKIKNKAPQNTVAFK